MWPFLLTLLWQLKRGQVRLLFEYHDFLVQSKGLFDVGLLYGCMDKNDQSFFDMVPIWNSSITWRRKNCMEEEALYVDCGPFLLVFWCCGYLHSAGVLLS